MAATQDAVLVVDDPDGPRDVDARLDTALDASVVVTGSAPEALSTLRSRRIDCVVSRLEVPDEGGVECLGGLTLLERVRERYDVPFVLFTDVGSEDIAQEASELGVTDYVLRWDPGTSADRLIGMVGQAVARYRAERRAERMNRITEVIRDVNQALVRASTRAEIERSVCERFADSEQYRLAWCGAPVDATGIERDAPDGLGSGRSQDGSVAVESGVAVHAWGNVEDPPDAPLTVASEADESGPVRRAVETSEVQVVQRALTEPSFEPWREEAERWEYGAMAAVPFVYEDVSYGVLAIYADRPGVFDATERAVLAELGDTIADAIDAVRARTEIEHRETELARQNERLEEFVNIVSHDLRNPLGVAQGYLHQAREETDSEPLEEVQISLDRMEELIEDLLTLAREGRRIDSLGDVDVRTVAADAWNGVETGGASIEYDGEPATIEADRSRLSAALENLFRNAVEHGSTSAASDDPDPDLTVRVGRLPDGGFYVEDTGQGIPPTERDSVLEMGYTTSEDGTGFGLGIVSEVVEAHGWSLTLDESEAGGARFEIRT